MGAIENHYELARRITPEVISKDLFDFIQSVQQYMVDLNQKQIKEDSQDIYGDAIGFYSRATDLITGGKKKEGDPFDGDSTGKWLNDFYMSISGTVLSFGSTDPKTDDILSSDNWLSVDLFGLTEENLNLVISEKILPFVQLQSRQYLNL